jgi:DMSO/TMAO reductase YedYZ heme-binding membrane subunit
MPSEKKLYYHALIFSLLSFFAFYYYGYFFLGFKDPLNKAVADASIFLVGCSMVLGSMCYFWNFLDSKVIYKKHLGLIGFAFSLIHIGLSFPALKRLVQIETWQENMFWAPLTGLIAAVIFTVMALISNKFAATHLGGKTWRSILHTGYIAIILTWIHVVVLKSHRWGEWLAKGMPTPPSGSLLVSIFMIFVILMRVALWISLKNKARATQPKT